VDVTCNRCNIDITVDITVLFYGVHNYTIHR